MEHAYPKKIDHITPVLKDLHWLPVECRVDFKILLLTHKALHGKAPQYLADLLMYRERRVSRSSYQNFLDVPKTKCKTFGDRAFAVYAPCLWNKLPLQIRLIDSVDEFKSAIKTHLFVQHYGF